jgi:dTDP-L-rhamnose 4-epimerase
MRILVTGGAGFIGSFLTDALVELGHVVRILDNLEPQVHQGKKPDYLHPEAEFMEGDVRDRAMVEKALHGVEALIHCASAVGVGQAQYEIKRYSDVNVGGTANLLDVIVNSRLPVRSILLPSSMTGYGEGMYLCARHGAVRPGLRSTEQLERKDFALHCPQCGDVVIPVPTPETADRQSAGMYALTKNMQEEMILSTCRTYGIKATALRLFNVYGPRQSLSNPYTGVSAIFLSRLKNGKSPVIYEDGKQSRDFVSVHDVVSAFLLALDSDTADGQVCNIGSGTPTSISELASMLSRITGMNIPLSLPGTYRKNDVCHCFADTRKARSLLGWETTVSLEQGLRELIDWSGKQEAVDRFEEAERILRSKTLQS